MNDTARMNKLAWEYRAYDFWVRQNGAPEEMAARIAADPAGSLKRYAAYLGDVRGQRVANICGSCGKKALAIALLGAEVTVFDISGENRRYAMEAAQAANTRLDYQVRDVMALDSAWDGQFDTLFMEGGVLHYFHDLPAFMAVMHRLLRPGGRMICSDFHPLTKVIDALHLEQPARSYFDDAPFEGEMAHARFYAGEERAAFPQCSYRKHTLSDIINGAVGAGFALQRFDEHPSWADPALPGEFTMIAIKA